VFLFFDLPTLFQEGFDLLPSPSALSRAGAQLKIAEAAIYQSVGMARKACAPPGRAMFFYRLAHWEKLYKF